jgi:hypothetical protein
MPYHVGAKGSNGCSGYPAVKDDGTVMGCHKTRSQAAAQIYAINMSEGNIDKAMPNLKEGDWALTSHGEEDEFHIGQVVHVMREGMLGLPGGEYTLEASAENPAVLIQLYEQEEDGFWEATREYSACMMSLMIPIDPLPMEPELADMETAMDGAMMYQKAQMANAPYQDAELDSEDSAEIELAAKPKYEDMIKPRSGGSTPSNPRLYARIVQEAKDKFDVYPSAVANGWVVQEYKRRGGTYKMYNEDMDKREFSTASRERMAEAGTAMPDGSFPISSRSDLMNAIRSVGRAKDYGAARAHIIRRARALNAMDMLPEDWRNKATKGTGQWSGSIFDLNPFVK